MQTCPEDCSHGSPVHFRSSNAVQKWSEYAAIARIKFSQWKEDRQFIALTERIANFQCGEPPATPCYRELILPLHPTTSGTVLADRFC